MDPEFIRVTTRVMAIGLMAVTIGTLGLFFAFRSFGAARENRGFAPFAILLGTAVFILLICLVLLRWSFAVR